MARSGWRRRIAELIAPGFFLIFLAAVGLGRRWYRRNDTTEDPLLNDRVARLIGTTAEVCEPIVAGKGRVRIGDGAWIAQGRDAEAGAIVRITGASGAVLQVDPV